MRPQRFAHVWSLHCLTYLLTKPGTSLPVLALIIALGLDGSLIVSRLLGGSKVVPAGSPPWSAKVPSHANPRALLATILNAHLFGSAPAGNDDSTPTAMSLILAGVIASADPGTGQAIIGESAATAKLYSVNAMVPGGARLHAVYRDRVLLEHNGVLETLALPRTPLSTAAAQSGAALVPDVEVQESPSLFDGLVHIQPFFSRRKLVGYRIFPGGLNGSGAFNQLGLRPGDLILAVNGTSLDDPARALKLLQTLSSAGNAMVTVSRSGSAQEVNLNLANLANLDRD
jgi:general secretion pathway protein C